MKNTKYNMNGKVITKYRDETDDEINLTRFLNLAQY